MKKLFLLFTLCIISAANAFAVLQERDLNQTIIVLRQELENDYRFQKSMMKQLEDMSEAQHINMIKLMQKSDQTALMLYSQKSGFTFDLAYACQQATDQYKSYKVRNLPYEKIRNNIEQQVQRYDGLIHSLKTLPPSIDDCHEHDSINIAENDSAKIAEIARELEQMGNEPFMLNEEQQAMRDECILFATALRNNYLRILNSILKDKEFYAQTENKLKELNDYAMGCYKQLQEDIFVNGDRNYFTTIMRLGMSYTRAKQTIDDKYMPFRGKKNVKSYWRGPVVMGISIYMLVFIVAAFFLSWIIIFFIVPFFLKRRNTSIPKEKKILITLTCAIAIFCITVGAMLFVVKHNFIIMASSLMIRFGWVLEAILISLLVRLAPNQIKAGMRLYSPLLWMSFIVIGFRMVLIPNNVVNLIYPPILVLFTYWQYYVLHHRLKEPVPANEIQDEADIDDDSDDSNDDPDTPSPNALDLQTNEADKQKLDDEKRLQEHLEQMEKISEEQSNNGSPKMRKISLPERDLVNAFISLLVMIASSISAWVGYTLLAVQIMMWWMLQLAIMQTIACVYDLLRSYEVRRIFPRLISKMEFPANAAHNVERQHKLLHKAVHSGDFITKTWFFDLIERAVVPVVSVLSIMISIYFAARMFEMSAMCRDIFFKDFIKEEGMISLSLFKICLVLGYYFVFSYISYAARGFYRHYRLKKLKGDKKKFNRTLAHNIIAILVWGIYFIWIMVLLRVPRSGISIVTAGLATGMGFAMKDLLENFFYGISLMTGRVRVGDWIECDGIQGQVDSITYQSTQILTRDGSIIAFLNAALFNKNFKNLTKNHNYELAKVPFGIAYGCNVDEVRKMVVEAFETKYELPSSDIEADKRTANGIHFGKKYGVAFVDFGESSVDLVFACWVQVDLRIQIMGEIREMIYNTLNAHNIEIPFPQRDINFRNGTQISIKDFEK